MKDLKLGLVRKGNSTMDFSIPNFFKIYLPCLSSKLLKIPIAFLKHFKGERTSGRVSLIGPSKNIWNVLLIEKKNGVFFEDGWPLFVKDHFIKTGDFLVFGYNGNLVFTVQIFDTSGCEKESAFYAINSQETTSPNSIKDKMKKRRLKNVVEVSDDSLKRKSKVEIVDLSIEGTSISNVGGNCLSNESEKRVARNRLGSYISQRRVVTKEEGAKALKSAMEFKSKNPCWVVVMRESHVYFGYYVPFPKSLSHSCLPPTSREMTIWDPSGKPWPVRYLYTNARGGLSAGWAVLSRQNNIEADDVCIFELIKQNQMKLHIFRVVHEIKPLLRSRSYTRTETSGD